MSNFVDAYAKSLELFGAIEDVEKTHARYYANKHCKKGLINKCQLAEELKL